MSDTFDHAKQSAPGADGLTPDARRLERAGIATCKPNCGCQGLYDVRACRDWDRGVRLIQYYRQPLDEDT